MSSDLLESMLVWAIVGALGQLVDGALGMAYGVSCTAVLVSIGIGPALASASVHTAKVFTGLVSGGSHLKLGNVEHDIALRLIAPGVIGGVVGAYVCTSVPGRPLTAIVGCILLAMGLIVLHRFVFKHSVPSTTKRLSSRMLLPLGCVAGFTDALGGGGWGPVTTTTLVANKIVPNKAVGSVNFAEFFVTTSEAITFLLLIGWGNFNWFIVLGLIAGGIVCAPIAAWLCKRLPRRALGVLVGAAVVVLSIRMILGAVGVD